MVRRLRITFPLRVAARLVAISFRRLACVVEALLEDWALEDPRVVFPGDGRSRSLWVRFFCASIRVWVEAARLAAISFRREAWVVAGLDDLWVNRVRRDDPLEPVVFEAA